MAAHTPVIGLMAILDSVSGEWRVSGRGCGLRELVKVVCGYAEVVVVRRRTTAAAAADVRQSGLAPCALRASDSSTTPANKVKEQ